MFRVPFVLVPSLLSVTVTLIRVGSIPIGAVCGQVVKVLFSQSFLKPIVPPKPASPSAGAQNLGSERRTKH